MNIQQIYVAVTLDDGTTAIMGFLTVAQGSYLPQGPDAAEWLGGDKGSGWWKRPTTDANIFAEIVRVFAVGPQPVKWRRINEANIPADRTFRNALTDDGTKLHHPIEKCRPIHLDRLRRDRLPLLEQLDRDWMRATGAGDKTEADRIEAKRQKLRDITKHPGITSATTPEDLKKITVASE